MMYSQVSTISANELKDRMANHEDLIILDVRQPDERADFHVAGDTLFIPLAVARSYRRTRSVSQSGNYHLLP